MVKSSELLNKRLPTLAYEKSIFFGNIVKQAVNNDHFCFIIFFSARHAYFFNIFKKYQKKI